MIKYVMDNVDNPFLNLQMSIVTSLVRSVRVNNGFSETQAITINNFSNSINEKLVFIDVRHHIKISTKPRNNEGSYNKSDYEVKLNQYEFDELSELFNRFIVASSSMFYIRRDGGIGLNEDYVKDQNNNIIMEDSFGEIIYLEPFVANLNQYGYITEQEGSLYPCVKLYYNRIRLITYTSFIKLKNFAKYCSKLDIERRGRESLILAGVANTLNEDSTAEDIKSRQFRR